MPAWQAARIDSIALVPAPRPHNGASCTPAAYAGTRMTITFRPFPLSPVRLAWDAEITGFAWDDHFCDIQLSRGPFRSWRHCHRVRPERRDGIDGTLLTDEVQYELPLGALGEIAHALLLRRQIEAAFAFRHAQTLRLLQASPASTSIPQTIDV